MSPLDALELNLLTPMVLAFGLGLLARLVRSDLEMPEPLVQALAIYLLLAIGLKGGAALAATPASVLLLPAAVTLVLGSAIPVWSYAILRLGRLDRANAAALAAHYGSVSAVTFVAAVTLVEEAGLTSEGYLPALVALMEIPAIVIALLLARRGPQAEGSWGRALHDALAGKSIFLLAGGVAIGWAAGPQGYAEVAPFFSTLFKGVLTLFLLEMGLVTAARLADLRTAGPFVVTFALVMPVAHGCLGVWAGLGAGLSAGGAAVLGTLAASASYIAAPAAVRIALPQASPGIYLTAALGVTFPFNLAVGIPIYLALAQRLAP